MADELTPEEVVRSRADESLLSAPELPTDLEQPPAPPASRARGAIVGLGATLTGATLLGGLALAALGIAELLSGSSALGAIELAIGLVLAATHWGWVHVAEASAQSLEARGQREAQARRAGWLACIDPYARYEVSTRVTDDGSIEIVRVCHRPVKRAGDRFGFERIVQLREVHDPSEPAAAITERAEGLRRVAAQETETARERFEQLREEHDAGMFLEDSKHERLAADRAASEALSQRLNEKLRQPPLRG